MTRRRFTITVALPPLRAFVVVGALALGIGVGRAGVPADADALVYSGVLEEGGALVNAARNVAIEIYDVEIGGTALCRVNAPDLPIVGGRFHVAMSAECAADLREAGSDAFVEVQVDGEPVGTRARVGAVPFALEASAAHDVAPGSAADARIDLLEAATLEVNVKMRRTIVNTPNGQGVPLLTASFNDLVFDEIVYATHPAAYDATSGVFTAPIAGKYRFHGKITVALTTDGAYGAAGGNASILLIADASNAEALENLFQATLNSNMVGPPQEWVIPFSTSIPLDAGQGVRLRYAPDNVTSGGTRFSISNLNIERVGAL